MPRKKKEEGKEKVSLCKVMKCPSCKKFQVFNLVNGFYRCPICGLMKQK